MADDRIRDRVAELEATRSNAGTSFAETIRAEAPSGQDDLESLPRIEVESASSRRDLEILSLLGEGGMGEVHLARQRSLEREVAVKTLRRDAPRAAENALLREARITGALEHPGVIPVHALGVDERGRPTLVMKRVSGEDLAARLGGTRACGDELVATIEVLVQVCRTLELAHSRGVVHRDIKLDNIMVGAFGEVYLLDWGIATTVDESGRGPIVGTPVYMPPEMIVGDKVDARTDVYLLGATLHHVLTGQPRHDGGTMIEIARAAMASAPYAYGRDVPEELARLCNRATARDPSDRPATAAEMRDALTAFIRHRSARALAEAALERLAVLEELLEAPELDLSRAYGLVSEARFGLTQSLREHPGGMPAVHGMRRCLRAAIDLELRQEHVDSAEALARDVDPPDPALTARIDEKRKAIAARAAERKRLERLARDHDPTEQRRRRIVPLVVVAVALSLIAAFTALRGQEPSPGRLVLGGVFGLTVLGAVLVLLRRRMLSNRFNRRIAATFVTAVLGVVLNRSVGLLAGTAAATSLATDMLIGALVSAVAAIALLRRLWPATAVFAVGYAVARVWPAETAVAYALSVAVGFVAITLALITARRPT